jgi:hypothetical protein
MSDFRLGDIIDDHCIKCRRLTNHAIVSIINTEPAKVRCRTCYHDHDYRHEIAPPTKKELKAMELAAATSAGLEQDPATVEIAEIAGLIAGEDGAGSAPAAEPVKKPKARGKKA